MEKTDVNKIGAEILPLLTHIFKRESCLITSAKYPVYFYRKIYLHTNSTASTYISGVIFLALPVTRLMIT